MSNKPAFPFDPLKDDEKPKFNMGRTVGLAVAFPSGAMDEYGVIKSYSVEEGMTIRDYFAIGILQALLTSKIRANQYEFARRSYELADTMLAVREEE